MYKGKKPEMVLYIPMEFCMKLLTEDMIKIAQPVAAQSKPNLSTNTPPKVGPMKALEN